MKCLTWIVQTDSNYASTLLNDISGNVCISGRVSLPQMLYFNASFVPRGYYRKRECYELLQRVRTKKLYSKLEDWSLPWNLDVWLFCFSPFYRTLITKTQGTVTFSSLHSFSFDIHCRINWRKRIEQASRRRCKRETSIFEPIINSIVKKVFQWFYMA